MLSARDSCSRLREFSQTLRAHATADTPLDICDVLDISANLIASTFPCADPTLTISRDLHAFTTLSSAHQSHLLSRLNHLISDLSAQSASLKSRISATELSFQSANAFVNDRIAQALSHVDATHHHTLDRIRRDYASAERALQERARAALSSSESEVASRCASASTAWRAKLSAVDARIATYEKELHELLHLTKLSPAESLAEEDRRFAAQMERATRLAKQSQSALAAERDDLARELASLRGASERTASDAASALASLEEALIAERRALETRRTAEVAAVRAEASACASALDGARASLRELPASLAEGRRRVEEDLARRTAAAAAACARRIERLRVALVPKYEDEIAALGGALEELERRARTAQHACRQELATSVRAFELELRESERALLAERERLRSAVAERRLAGERAAREQRAALAEATHDLQRRLAGVVSEYERGEREHAQEIADLMKRFAHEEEGLVELQRAAMEARDRERADTLAEIRRNHGERRRAILDSVERRMREEQEAELRQALGAENARHEGTLAALQTGIGAVKQRLVVLEERVQQLQADNTANIERIRIEEEDARRRRAAETAAAIAASEAMIRAARQRLVDETGEIDRRKKRLFQESDSITETLDSLQQDLGRNISRLEIEYKIQKETLAEDIEGAQQRHIRLVSSVDQQKLRIHAIEERYIGKATEVLQYEDRSIQEKEQFEKSLTDEMQASFSFAKEKGAQLALQINQVKNMFAAELEELVAQVAAARETTGRVADRLLLERSQAIEGIDVALNMEWDERGRAMRERAAERMNALTNQFMDDQQASDESLLDMKMSHRKRMERLREISQENVQQLEQEKTVLIEEKDELSQALDLILHRGCEECVEKQRLWTSLKERQATLSEKILKLQKQTTKTDEMMNLVFIERDGLARPFTSSTTLKPRILRPTSRLKTVNPLSFKF